MCCRGRLNQTRTFTLDRTDGGDHNLRDGFVERSVDKRAAALRPEVTLQPNPIEAVLVIAPYLFSCSSLARLLSLVYV